MSLRLSLSRSPFVGIVIACLQACSPASSGNGTGGGNGTATGGASSPGSGGSVGSGGITGSGGVIGSVGSGGINNQTGGTIGSTGGTPGNAGGAPATGGNSPGTGGSVAGGRGGGASGGSAGTGGGGPPGALSIVTAWPYGAIMTGVRNVATPAVTDVLKVHNGGTVPVMITALTLTGTGMYKAAFQIMGMPALPAMLAAGADLPVTVQVMTSGAAIGPEPMQNDGGTVLTATLTATAGAASAQANIFGVLLTLPTHEITLGQILTMLGFKLNVGKAMDNANPNNGSSPSTLPKVEAGTDEVAAPLFKKGPTGMPTLRALARFSPKGPMPYGWYPMGMPTMHNVVSTMASMPDAQTSDKARMMLPPLTGAATFDPAGATFGIWVYSDQLSGKYDTGGTATNGDYNYSEDAPNSPANVHRTKVYPLKDAAGTAIPNSYLLAVEEAGNGDYQDFVFVLENVTAQ